MMRLPVVVTPVSTQSLHLWQYPKPQPLRFVEPALPPAPPLPSGIPPTITVDTDDCSVISTLSDYMVTPEPSPADILVRLESMRLDYLLKITKNSAALEYLTVKTVYQNQGKKVPNGMLQRIILESALRTGLPVRDALQIPVTAIRSKARALLKKRTGEIRTALTTTPCPY